MERRQLREVLRKVQHHLLQIPGVVGVGVGEKVQMGKGLQRKALVVYVREKIAAAALQPGMNVKEDPILRTHVADPNLDIDVKVIGRIQAGGRRREVHVVLPRDTDRRRPVQTGCSEGHFAITAGTGGVLVEGEEGQLRRLSNNHVYANENRADVGDAIFQPGPFDGGRSEDLVGLLASYWPINFDGGPNYIDAALRTLTDHEEAVVTGLPMSQYPLYTGEVLEGDRVVKSGRTTGVTVGEVIDTEATVQVEYDRGVALFEDQILIEDADLNTRPFSEGGDSGSAIFLDRADLPWCGLLFAGSDVITVANHAKRVEEIMHVKLWVPADGEVPSPPPPEEEKKGCLTAILGPAVVLLILVAMLL